MFASSNDADKCSECGSKNILLGGAFFNNVNCEDCGFVDNRETWKKGVQ